LTSNEHIVWLQPSSWSAIILIKWKVSFAVDGCWSSSFKDFDSHESAGWKEKSEKFGKN